VRGQQSIAIIPRPEQPKLNKIAQYKAWERTYIPVPHWGLLEVQALAQAAREQGRGSKGLRDALLVQVLFDGALRVSEALGLRPVDIVRSTSGYRLKVQGKTGYREVAVSPSLAAQLQSYAYEQHLGRKDRFFPITRARAWQLIEAAARRAGVGKPPGVGTVHILRHSGAIERMRLSGNPRSVQEQLGHTTFRATLRYLRTLTQEEALRVQEGVDFGW